MIVAEEGAALGGVARPAEALLEVGMRGERILAVVYDLHERRNRRGNEVGQIHRAEVLRRFPERGHVRPGPLTHGPHTRPMTYLAQVLRQAREVEVGLDEARETHPWTSIKAS